MGPPVYALKRRTQGVYGQYAMGGVLTERNGAISTKYFWWASYFARCGSFSSGMGRRRDDAHTVDMFLPHVRNREVLVLNQPVHNDSRHGLCLAWLLNSLAVFGSGLSLSEQALAAEGAPSVMCMRKPRSARFPESLPF